MKKINLVISALAICSAALFFTACSKKAPPLVVMTTADCVPFSMENDSKELVGFDIDLVKEIGKKLKRDIQIKPVAFEELLKKLQTKECDLAISAVSKTDDRSKVVDFSPAYHSSGFALLFLATTPIQTLDDLSEKIVGVRAGTLQETMFKLDDRMQSIRNMFTRSFDKFSTKDMIGKLLSGELNAVVVNADTAAYIIRKNPGFKILPLDVGNIDMCIAFPKGSHYKEKISTLVTEMNKSGEIAQIKDKWFSPSAR